MAFQFPLAAVLRYRQSIEQREYFALERMQQDVARVEQWILQVETESTVAIESRIAELARGTHAAEIRSAFDYQKSLAQRADELRLLLLELKAKWRQQLACYEQARRNRETLDKLREKQLETYNRDLIKREQAMIDDLFLARRRRGN